MIYKGVDIFLCKFFTIRKPEDGNGLKFVCGRHRSKTADDFNTVDEIKDAIAYCFWIIGEPDDEMPFYSKFAASCFINELTPKLKDLQFKITEIAIRKQQKLIEETKDSIHVSGTRYSDR